MASNSRQVRRDVIALSIAVLIPLAAGAFGAVFTAEAIPTWYAELQKPAWNPPAWLFGPVWTVLYVAMGVAAWQVWQLGNQSNDPATQHRVQTALVIYAMQLVVNGIWSPTFFGLRRPELALGVIVVLWVLVVMTIQRFYRLHQAAGLLLVPYLLWVTFATMLNASIWQLNR